MGREETDKDGGEVENGETREPLITSDQHPLSHHLRLTYCHSLTSSQTKEWGREEKRDEIEMEGAEEKGDNLANN